MITGFEGRHCDVCDEFRLDAWIAVHRIALPGALGYTQVHYCKDRDECRDAAQAETMPFAHANLNAARLMREYQAEHDERDRLAALVPMSPLSRWLRSLRRRWWQ
jgi:hypothetical protein